MISLKKKNKKCFLLDKLQFGIKMSRIPPPAYYEAPLMHSPYEVTEGAVGKFNFKQLSRPQSFCSTR